MSTRLTGARVPALCCICGNVRTVSDRHSAGSGRVASWEAGDVEAEELAEYWQAGLYIEHQRGWRCLTILKCKPCGERTRHALVRADDSRNYAEDTDRERDRRGRTRLP